MKALEYETLVRRVNGCGRSRYNGADADIYRVMERAFLHLNDPLWLKSKEEKKFDCRKAFGTVHQYVSNAIDYGTGLLRNQMEEADRAVIEILRKSCEKTEMTVKNC